MLESERWQRVDAIFDGALELSVKARPAYLDRACAGDAQLRREVESLLKHERRAVGELEEGLLALGENPFEGRAEDPPTEGELGPGARVGPYRLERLLGSGGMGRVFLATRDDSEVARRVAIKLMRPSSDRARIVARFLAERQILAALEHPGIARLYDAGSTAEGVPYLVMEYVDGERITDYCRRRNLDVDQRLRLFIKVCEAVQYAHQNLLVHRDLKPANILVGEDGRPKLLDFGIAKALEPDRLGSAHLATRTDERPMTPGYASPEQVQRQAITTATDVYSLGVLLYEILAGTSPYTKRSDLPHEIERAIVEDEPVLASEAARSSTAQGDSKDEATERGSGLQPRELGRRLRGDLDSILHKALAKSPQARYGSAAALAEDLERHLSGVPVNARRATLGYRAGRFLRRNRYAVGAAAVVLFSAFAVLATLAGQRVRIAAERDRAELANAESQQTLEFLLELFAGADPGIGNRGSEISALDLLDSAHDNLGQLGQASPEVRATVLSSLGQIYDRLAHFEKAEPLLHEALSIRRRHFGERHSTVAASLSRLADLLHRTGRYDAAAEHYRQSVALSEALGSPDPYMLAGTLDGLGAILREKGEHEEAESLHHRSLALKLSTLGPKDPSVALTYNYLGTLLREKGEYAAAEDAYRKALDIRSEVLGEDHFTTGLTLASLGNLADRQGRHEEAVELLRRGLELNEAVFDRDHPDVTLIRNNLAAAVHRSGDLEAAEPLYREVLADNVRNLGEDHPASLTTTSNLAVVLQTRGDFEGAEELHQRILKVKKAKFGDRHPEVAQTYHHLAEIRRKTGRAGEAIPLYQDSFDILVEVLGEAHPNLAYPAFGLGLALLGEKRFAEAEPWLRLASEKMGSTFPEDHPRVAAAQGALGESLLGLGRLADAEPLLMASYRVRSQRYPADSRQMVEARRRLTELSRVSDRPELIARFER